MKNITQHIQENIVFCRPLSRYTALIAVKNTSSLGLPPIHDICYLRLGHMNSETRRRYPQYNLSSIRHHKINLLGWNFRGLKIKYTFAYNDLLFFADRTQLENLISTKYNDKKYTKLHLPSIQYTHATHEGYITVDQCEFKILPHFWTWNRELNFRASLILSPPILKASTEFIFTISPRYAIQFFPEIFSKIEIQKDIIKCYVLQQVTPLKFKVAKRNIDMLKKYIKK